MAFDRSINRSAFYRLTDNPSVDWMRIPPLPQMIIMRDRADNTRWLLSHNTTESSPDGLGYISITNSFQDNGDIVEFGPYEGPIVNSVVNDLKLLIRGGYLGYEYEPPPRYVGDRRQARVLTRRGVARVTREIIVPIGWNASPDVLGWSPVEV